MKSKKKLTLSIRKELIEAIEFDVVLADFNISEFVESSLMKEFKRRGVKLKCPFCGK